MIGMIPAAGKGLRFKELGKQYPKAVLPYKEKPLIIHNIEWLKRHNCDDIRIIVNHKSEKIKEIVNYYYDDISFIIQEKQTGLSSAIFSALLENDTDSVLIVLGDLFVKDNISNFNKNFISIQKVNDYKRWCMVECDNLSVKNFIDKPQEKPNTNLALSGVYYFNNAKLLYNAIKKQLQKDIKISNEYQLSSAMGLINEEIFIKELDIIDFGTLEEYQKNKNVSISRSFNDIIDDDDFITKKSNNKINKIIDEYNWYENIPYKLKKYTPKIYDHDFYSNNEAKYIMEKIQGQTLREIYLFLDSSVDTWENIFKNLFDILEKQKELGQKNDFLKSTIFKTKQRVLQIKIDIDENLVNSFIEDYTKIINNTKDKYSVMHGDFCFSNILYNMSLDSIKLIDPRGAIFGSLYYDVAKLMHSVIYDYDFIDQELYFIKDDKLTIYNDGKENIKELFISLLKKYFTEKEINLIKYITAGLFLSMIPLHYHNINNQVCYYKIFKNIYREVK